MQFKTISPFTIFAKLLFHREKKYIILTWQVNVRTLERISEVRATYTLRTGWRRLCEKWLIKQRKC